MAVNYGVLVSEWAIVSCKTVRDCSGDGMKGDFYDYWRLEAVKRVVSTQWLVLLRLILYLKEWVM